jgi:hypothetical protein
MKLLHNDTVAIVGNQPNPRRMADIDEFDCVIRFTSCVGWNGINGKKIDMFVTRTLSDVTSQHQIEHCVEYQQALKQAPIVGLVYHARENKVDVITHDRIDENKIIVEIDATLTHAICSNATTGFCLLHFIVRNNICIPHLFGFDYADVRKEHPVAIEKEVVQQWVNQGLLIRR